MHKLKLETSTDQMDDLHRAADKARKGGKVKVERDALMALLIDHGRLLKVHEGRVEA